MPDLRLEVTTYENRKTTHLLRISPELFVLQVNDEPLDFMTAVIVKQGQKVIQKLNNICENGFMTPLGIAYPGALRMIGIEDYMEVPHDRLISMNFAENSVRIDEEDHHAWDIKTCTARLNLKGGPSRNHPLHETYDSEKELELRKEALGFAIGISDSLKDNLDRFTETLLTGLGTFAAVNEHFTNDDREFRNYVSVCETRVTRILEVLKQNGAIIGDRGLFPTSYQQGPTLQVFREMSREKDILLGQAMGKIALKHSDDDIIQACLALGRDIKLRLEDDYTFRDYKEKTLSAHEQMAAMTVKSQLQDAFASLEAA